MIHISTEWRLIALAGGILLVSVGVAWLACRVFIACDREIQNNFDTVTKRRKS